MNNIRFWTDYNQLIKEKMQQLLYEKDKLLVDLHIHSEYSTDGKQSLEEIIKNTSNLGFDIISITDHDNINVYDELYSIIISNNLNLKPIIIPGIEFTVDCKDYGSQCHILQYFINPKDAVLQNDIKVNENAGWQRAKKQFERLYLNKAIQYLLKDKIYNLNMNDYKYFLIESNLMVPEYTTLAEYIKLKLLDYNITVLDVFEKLEEYNKQDRCEKRRKKIEKRYRYLREKYKNIYDANTSTRLLLSLLAVKGVDDNNYKGYESSGSLSINEYGQIKIDELNKKYLTIFAHPNSDKLNIIRNIEKYNKNIKGIENNYRNKYTEKEKNEFLNIAREKDFIITKGSDSHNNDNTFYKDIDFYKISKDYIKELIMEKEMLGVENGKVRLENYDENWEKEYHKEEEILKKLIGNHIMEIQHVGSTSIPGMKAKPIIDIAILVEKLENNNPYIYILKKAGYEYRDDNAMKGEHLFKKVKNGFTTHLIHIVEKNSIRWNNFILFKNYMLQNQDEVQNYIKLKEKLEAKYSEDRTAYTNEKNNYIKMIIEKEEQKNGIK